MKIVAITILILIPILDYVIAKGDQLFDIEEDIDEE